MTDPSGTRPPEEGEAEQYPSPEARMQVAAYKAQLQAEMETQKLRDALTREVERRREAESETNYARSRAEQAEAEVARLREAAETALGFFDGGELDNALYTIDCDIRNALTALSHALEPDR